ncbi:MAG: hypothetical protein JWO85_2247 [Candidatus Eremiobacteraeota bacterium]|nr:hypothetical protein [Candidatus Eremiobacteraeota bacterium]
MNSQHNSQLPADAKGEPHARVSRSDFAWVTLPDKARRLTPQEFLVRCVLRSFDDPSRPGECYPSIPTIGDLVLAIPPSGKPDYKHVRSVIQSLEKKGAIRVEHRAGPKATHRFFFCNPPGTEYPRVQNTPGNEGPTPPDDDGGVSSTPSPPGTESPEPRVASTPRSDQGSNHKSNQVDPPSARADDAAASPLVPDDLLTQERNDAGTQPALLAVDVTARHDADGIEEGGKPSRKAKSQRPRKEKRDRPDTAWVAPLEAAFQPLLDRSITIDSTDDRMIVARAFVHQFGNCKANESKNREKAAGVATALVGIGLEAARKKEYAGLTVRMFFKAAKKRFEFGEQKPFFKPWEALGFLSFVEGDEPGQRRPPWAPAEPERRATFWEIKKATLPPDEYEALRAKITARAMAQRAQDEADAPRYSENDDPDEGEVAAITAGDGKPQWVREIEAFEIRLARAPLHMLTLEGGDRGRLGALHALLFCAVDWDDEDATTRQGQRCAGKLEPLCSALRDLDRSFTVADYCATAVALLDESGATSVTVEQVADAILSRLGPVAVQAGAS